MKDVGEDIDCSGNVGIERFGVVNGVFALAISVCIAKGVAIGLILPKCTHLDDLPCFRFRAPIDVDSGSWYPVKPVSFPHSSSLKLLNYLECQMFQEMSGPVSLIRLGSAPGIDPNTDSGSLRPRRMLGRNLTDISQRISINQTVLTVNPLDNVVLSVCAPLLTGVANPLSNDIDWKALRFRNALVKLSASRCVAIAMDEFGGGHTDRD